MGSVQYFIIKYDVTCGIFLDAFYRFIMKWCWVLLNAFYASAERIIKYISCILLIWYVTLTIFDGMLNHCCISGINLTRGVKFFIYVAYFDFVEYFDVHIHKGYLSIVFLCFFFPCATFGFNKRSTGIRMSWKVFFLLFFWGSHEGLVFLIQHSVEFTSEALGFSRAFWLVTWSLYLLQVYSDFLFLQFLNQATLESQRWAYWMRGWDNRSKPGLFWHTRICC